MLEQPQPVNVNNSPLVSLSSVWHHIAESATVLKIYLCFHIFLRCSEWVITWPVSFERKPAKLDRTLKKLRRKNASLAVFLTPEYIVSILGGTRAVNVASIHWFLKVQLLLGAACPIIDHNRRLQSIDLLLRKWCFMQTPNCFSSFDNERYRFSYQYCKDTIC